MEFEAYLQEKKIDPALFQEAEPGKYQQWKVLFDQVHPTSFTSLKKFLINDIRRLYLLKAVETPPPTANTPVEAAAEVKKPARPVVKRPVIPRKTE